MLTNLDFARRFDRVAGSFEGMISGYSVYRRYQALLPHIRGKILNAGTGTGSIRRVCEPGTDITHLDISLNMCREARNKTDSPTICADAETLPVANGSFDTVVSSEMVYYLNAPGRFFKEAFRCLKPGGYLLVTSANQEAVFYDRLRTLMRSAGFSRAYFDDGARRFLTSGQLEQLFIDNGFDIVMKRNILTLPIESLQWLDRWLENTRLSRCAMFIVMAGEKTA